MSGIRRLSSISTEEIEIEINATKNGAPYTPTSDIVYAAFVGAGVTPGSSDWKAASWTLASTPTIQCLVGPSGGVIAPPVGTYVIWVKIVDSPGTYVLQAGTLVVFAA